VKYLLDALQTRPDEFISLRRDIGNGEGDRAGACMVHNPGYDFNDANVAIGGAYWVLLVERFLGEEGLAAAR
jgi:metal-dependent amidase/aminoacylase/carboxypeptidase family protein